MQLETFKTELGQILNRYQIPMDDKSFIMDKIEDQLVTLAKEVTNHIQEERAKDGARMADYEKRAKAAVLETVKKAQDSVKQAYQIGVKEGMGQVTGKPSGPGLFQILITVGLLGLAGFVVFREFFPKKDR